MASRRNDENQRPGGARLPPQLSEDIIEPAIRERDLNVSGSTGRQPLQRNAPPEQKEVHQKEAGAATEPTPQQIVGSSGMPLRAVPRAQRTAAETEKEDKGDESATEPSPQQIAPPSGMPSSAAPGAVPVATETHTFKPDPYQPPYEKKIDARIPQHFSTSARNFDYPESDDTKYERTYAFMKKALDYFQGKKIRASLSLMCAVTNPSIPDGTYDARSLSPPFFAVYVDEDAVANWLVVHQDLRAMVAEHFDNTAPFDSKDPAIRYFITPGVLYSDIQSPEPSQLNASPPASSDIATLSTPESSLLRFFNREKPGRIETDRLHQLYREERPYLLPKGPLMCASISVYRAKDNKFSSAGTLGAFFLLKDDKGEYIPDKKNNPQVFGLTCHHVLSTEGDDRMLKPDDAETKEIKISHLAQRDRENTYYTRKYRILDTKAELRKIEKLAKPGTDEYNALSVEQQQRIHDQLWTKSSIEQQLREDYEAAKRDTVKEMPIGELYLRSGRRADASHNSLLEPWKGTTKHGTTLIDYALFRIDPEFYGQCQNTIGSSYRWPSEYPQALDLLRSHRTMLNIVPLQPNTTVMKAGRSTGITCGQVRDLRRTTYIRPTVTLPTHEVYVEPLSKNIVFGGHGDSGAVIIDQDGGMVGILCAGDKEGTKGAFRPVYITPSQVWIADMKKYFGLTPVAYAGHDESEKPADSSPPTNSSLAHRPASQTPGGSTVRVLKKRNTPGTIQPGMQGNKDRVFSGASGFSDMSLALRDGFTATKSKGRNISKKLGLLKDNPRITSSSTVTKTSKWSLSSVFTTLNRVPDVDDAFFGEPPSKEPPANGTNGKVLDSRLNRDGDVEYLVAAQGQGEGEEDWFPAIALNRSWQTALEAHRLAQLRQIERSTSSGEQMRAME